MYVCTAYELCKDTQIEAILRGMKGVAVSLE